MVSSRAGNPQDFRDGSLIAVTAYAYASDEEKIMASGFDGYTAKPINANLLRSKIIALLEKHLILL